MHPLPPANRPSPAETAFRRLLTRAEAETLLGMLLVVCSLFLAWGRENLTPELKRLGLSGAVFAGGLSPTHSGFFYPSLCWPLLGGAILCGASLLWPPEGKTRVPVSAVHGACALACLLIALIHFALLPGALLGVLGAALLTLGAIDRYVHANPK
ncbi:MAG TPA: hypothetical protein VFA07_01355 [Chthonomonadaceae bacterium]|nr:hypothetical protein [Chthonomonadaceae bacterium]